MSQSYKPGSASYEADRQWLKENPWSKTTTSANIRKDSRVQAASNKTLDRILRTSSKREIEMHLEELRQSGDMAYYNDVKRRYQLARSSKLAERIRSGQVRSWDMGHTNELQTANDVMIPSQSTTTQQENGLINPTQRTTSSRKESISDSDSDDEPIRPVQRALVQRAPAAAAAAPAAPAAPARRARKQRACKYGARLANGKCPPRPRPVTNKTLRNRCYKACREAHPL